MSLSLRYYIAVRVGCHQKWDGDVGRGTWDVGRWRRRVAGTRGCEEFGTRSRAGIRGCDKQIAPDFCAELVKYFFLRVKCKII